MANTVIGVYDNFLQARSAMKQLLVSGFSSRDVSLRPGEDTAQARAAALKAAGVGAPDSKPESGTLRSFFDNLFGDGDNVGQAPADRYAEAVRRGSFVLTADADSEQQRDAAAVIMEQFQPIDIDERASRWQAGGWSRHDEVAMPMSDDELTQERDEYMSRNPSAGAPGVLGATGATGTAGAADAAGADNAASNDTVRTDQTAIPIVEEELQVGKREVQRGGVRVFQRVVETPVQETINLREEHVTIERHAVDQPATAADIASMKEGTLELREMTEEAVVAKTARVVEEVVIGKEITEKETTVSDSVRRTDVEIRNVEATDMPAAMTQATATPSPATYLIDEDFRHHWQNAYGQGGERYEDYAPAYQYGATLAGDQRYRGHEWSSDETTIRQQWEASHPHGTWDKVRDAVKYGWSKATH